MINSNYIWQIDTYEDVNIDCEDLDPVLLQLLTKRGITTPEQINRFLYPNLDLLYNPMLLKDLDKAVNRIKKAIDKGEKITIYGDYDVDGITSTCLLIKLLRSLDGRVDYYIPSRLHEGYGLNNEAIDTIYKRGTDLIITVDNGITSINEVKFAMDLGIDVIITDHHEPQEFIPQAVAVVNPKQKDCPYPFKELAGVGVALKLAQALGNLDYESMQEYLEFAAIGTVADVVPLLDENRIIVKHGLKLLENTKNKGIQALKTLLNLHDKPFDTFKIGFIIAPRINAAGRMADPDIAVELLLCEEEDRALELARALEDINQERQATEAKILNEAKEIAQQKADFDMDGAIVISDPTWHPGVLGTVASKLAETYNRPCILIVEEGEEGRGSGRSIPGINLFEAVSKASKKLIRYGGHEQALGLTIKVENINSFTRELNNYICKKMTSIDLKPKLEIDMELKPKDINLSLAKQIELMEPFGFGNPKPVFMCKNMVIKKMRAVGEKDKHLKLGFKKRKKPLSAIGFNFGHYKEDLNFAPALDIVFSLEVNRWQGIVEPQLNLKDIKVPYLKDELFYNIEEKYYKSFFTGADKELFISQKAACVNNSCIFFRKNGKRKTDYLASLLKEGKKVLIITSTPYSAWQLLANLKNSESMVANLEIYYNGESLRNSIHNSILINPFTSLEDVDFDDIVFYDTPFSFEIFSNQIKSLSSNSKVHLLFEREDLRYNYLVCQQVLPSVNDMRIIYTVLGRTTSGRFVGTFNLRDFRDLLTHYLGKDVHYVGLLNVFRIFKEIDIIDFNVRDDFIDIVEFKKHKEKLKLESSDTYKILSILKNKVVELGTEFDSFKNILNNN